MKHGIRLQNAVVSIRDAPIIGIRLLSAVANNWNHQITMPVSANCYLLRIMMTLDTEIIFFLISTDDKFSFYSYICKLGKHAGSVV